MYIYCDKVTQDLDRGQMQYSLKSWAPRDSAIADLACQLQTDPDAGDRPWERYISDGQDLLRGQEVAFERPPPETDRLFMNLGGEDVIEVGHPPPPDGVVYYSGRPSIRCGAIASGKPIVNEDQLRLEFAARHQCVAVDTEFDQVLESIVGNRKESFAFIRGVADYLDGTKNPDWQPYCALAAAALMKAIVELLPATS